MAVMQTGIRKLGALLMSCEIVDLLKCVIALAQCDQEKLAEIRRTLGQLAGTAGGAVSPDSTSSGGGSSSRSSEEKGAGDMQGNRVDITRTRSENHGSTADGSAVSASRSAGECAPQQSDQEKDRLIRKLETEQENVRTLEREKKLLAGELETERGKVSNLEQEKNRLAGEIETEQGNVRNLEQERRHLAGELETERGNVRNLEQEKRRLDGELETVRGKVRNLELEKSRLGQERDNSARELRDLNERFSSLARRIEAVPCFDQAEKLEKQINSLPERIRNFPGISLLHFDDLLTLCAQCGDSVRIRNIWNNVKSEIIKSPVSSPELAGLLRTLAEIYNRANQNAALEVFSPDIGSRFEPSSYARPNGVSPDVVREVLIPGLLNSRGDVLAPPVIR